MTSASGTLGVALISGAARGIGSAVAIAFAEAGYDVAMFDVCRPVGGAAHDMSGREDLDATMAGITSRGRRCHGDAVDVRDLPAVENFIADAESALGPITAVCANAGLSTPARPFWEIDAEQWQLTLDVNLTGVWHLARAVAPRLVARGRGSIVVMASTNGRDATPGGAGYCASKHGVLGLSKTIAAELAPHGVRCNAVLPGRIETPLVGRATGGGPRPDDRRYTALRDVGLLPTRSVADAVMWLAGDGAAHITGTELVVDAGGQLLRGLNPRYVDDRPQ